MPLYEYECDANGHRFEVIRKFSDPPDDTCPICGSSVHKLFSSPAIQFKGTGWYITDYAKKDSTAAGKTGGSKEGATGGDNAKGKSESASNSAPSTAASDSAPSTPAAPAKKD
jgi:putative FmdB family regulatory protein